MAHEFAARFGIRSRKKTVGPLLLLRGLRRRGFHGRGLGDLFDRGAAGLGVEQHGLVGREHFLDALDVGQLRRGAPVVEGAKVFVAGQALAHLEDFNVTVLQFPDLSLDEDEGRGAFSI